MFRLIPGLKADGEMKVMSLTGLTQDRDQWLAVSASSRFTRGLFFVPSRLIKVVLPSGLSKDASFPAFVCHLWHFRHGAGDPSVGGVPVSKLFFVLSVEVVCSARNGGEGVVASAISVVYVDSLKSFLFVVAISVSSWRSGGDYAAFDDSLFYSSTSSVDSFAVSSARVGSFRGTLV